MQRRKMAVSSYIVIKCNRYMLNFNLFEPALIFNPDKSEKNMQWKDQEEYKVGLEQV